MLVKATYKKTENAVVSRVRRDSTHPSFANSDRRMTYSTALPPKSDDIKDQYATVRPKLHVAEIISIQASERLAEILDPVYETIENGVTNEGYDSLDRSDADNDSGFIPNRLNKEEYYGFTNASSVSIDCQDWIRCISSPSSSVYDNSLNDYETKYLEHKFPNHPKPKARRRAEEGEMSDFSQDNIQEYRDGVQEEISEYEDSEDMLGEIMHYMENSDNLNDNMVILDPRVLCPNRKDREKIVFVVD